MTNRTLHLIFNKVPWYCCPCD